MDYKRKCVGIMKWVADLNTKIDLSNSVKSFLYKPNQKLSILMLSCLKTDGSNVKPRQTKGSSLWDVSFF